MRVREIERKKERKESEKERKEREREREREGTKMINLLSNLTYAIKYRQM